MAFAKLIKWCGKKKQKEKICSGIQGFLWRTSSSKCCLRTLSHIISLIETHSGIWETFHQEFMNFLVE